MALSDYQSVSLEKTRKFLPDTFERSDTLWSRMQRRMDVERVGQRAMRLPIKIRPGGKFRQVDLDGGDLGRGNSGLYNNATVSPVDILVAIETTKKAEYATDSSEKALFNVTKRDVADAMWTLRTMIDCLLQTPGTGQIGVITSGASGNGLTWVLGGNFGSNLILEGQTINTYDSTFATKRAGDSIVQTVDSDTDTVVVDANANSVDTDLVVIEGLSGANPVSLYGIPYHHSNAATGTWLGLNRATVPGIRTPAVNAGGANLTPAHVRLALNKSRMKVGLDTNPGEFVAWMHMAQEASWEETAQQQMVYNTTSNPNQEYNPFIVVKRLNGVPVLSGLHADPTRIDFLRLSDWGRAELKPIDYVRWGNDYVLPLYASTAAGGVKASQIWYMAASFQFFNQNPRAGVYIYNLAVPTGY